MATLWRFIWAVATNWAGYSTGGLIIAVVWLWSVWKDKPAPRYSLLILAGVFLFFVFFKAWNDERFVGDELRERMAELTDSKFELSVLSAFVGDEDANHSHIYLVANLKNLGAPSAVDALSWTLDATSNAGLTTGGAPRTLSPGNTDVSIDAKTFRRFVPADAIDAKASRVIERNGYVQGVLVFVFDGIDAAGLLKCRWRAGAKDVRDVGFSTETDAKTLQAAASKRTVLMPGLTYPVALTRGAE